MRHWIFGYTYVCACIYIYIYIYTYIYICIYIHWPTRLFRTNTQKKCPFHHTAMECKSRKSRNTWSNRQIWPWSTEWSRAKANRLLPRERTGHSKHPLPTTQEKTLYMDINRWPTPKSDWLHSLQPKTEKVYIVRKNKTWSWLCLRSQTHFSSAVVVWPFFGIDFLGDWNENWSFPVLWPLLSFPKLLAYWVQHFHSIIS